MLQYTAELHTHTHTHTQTVKVRKAWSFCSTFFISLYGALIRQTDAVILIFILQMHNLARNLVASFILLLQCQWFSINIETYLTTWNHVGFQPQERLLKSVIGLFFRSYVKMTRRLLSVIAWPHYVQFTLHSSGARSYSPFTLYRLAITSTKSLLTGSHEVITKLNRDVYCLGLYVPRTSAVEVLNAGKSRQRS
jgi:hypothetical protein